MVDIFHKQQNILNFQLSNVIPHSGKRPQQVKLKYKELYLFFISKSKIRLKDCPNPICKDINVRCLCRIVPPTKVTLEVTYLN